MSKKAEIEQLRHALAQAQAQSARNREEAARVNAEKLRAEADAATRELRLRESRADIADGLVTAIRAAEVGNQVVRGLAAFSTSAVSVQTAREFAAAFGIGGEEQEIEGSESPW